MKEPDYSKREIDLLIKDIYTSMSRQENQNELILIQTTKTNGTVAKLTTRADRTDKILYIVGAVVATLLITNSSELLQIFKLII